MDNIRYNKETWHTKSTRPLTLQAILSTVRIGNRLRRLRQPSYRATKTMEDHFRLRHGQPRRTDLCRSITQVHTRRHRIQLGLIIAGLPDTRRLLGRAPTTSHALTITITHLPTKTTTNTTTSPTTSPTKDHTILRTVTPELQAPKIIEEHPLKYRYPPRRGQ
jgi:hypothetical protein